MAAVGWKREGFECAGTSDHWSCSRKGAHGPFGGTHPEKAGKNDNRPFGDNAF